MLMGETVGKWRKPERKRRKKVNTSMTVMVMVLMGFAGSGNSMVDGTKKRGDLCLSCRERK